MLQNTIPIKRISVVVLRGMIAITFPFVVLLVAARLIMTPLFLQIEYTRPGFPADYYGFTVQDRLTYAPYALQYLLNGENISYLGNLRLSDGGEMYNVRELQHMRDVKVVTQAVFLLSTGVGILAIVAILILRNLDAKAIRQGFFSGSILTLGLIATVVIVAILSWDTFFTTFHNLFFQGGTWQFAYSDTLIRLFPEQFWFDAALIIGGFAVVVSLIALRLTTR